MEFNEVLMAFDSGGAATQGLLMAFQEGLGACWTTFNRESGVLF